VKVALDTNVLASALGTRGLCADLLRVVLLEHELVLGEQVLTELRKNLTKKFRVPAAVVAENEALLRAQAIVSSAAESVDLADLEAADVIVLGEAIAGGAEMFVTGDAELLALGKRAPLPVLSPRQLWTQLRSPK
jgi:putative PIN family toxin of toxin-antitoxin system